MATYLKRKAAELDSVPDVSNTCAWGDMLFSLQTHIDQLDNEVPPQVVEAAVTKLRSAITTYKQDTNQVVQDLLVCDTKMIEFLQPGHFMTNISTHVVELCIMTTYLSKLTMAKLYCLLRKKKQLLENSNTLARLVDANFQYDAETTAVLEYLLAIITIGFDNEHWKLAWQVYIEIKNSLSNTKNKDRENILNGLLTEVAMSSFSEKTCPSTKKANFDFENKAGQDAKLRMFALFFSLMGQEIITRTLPKGTFAKYGGFVPSLLRLSTTEVYNACNCFFNTTFLQCVHDDEDAIIIDKICKNFRKPKKADKKNNSGKRSILVEKDNLAPFNSL